VTVCKTVGIAYVGSNPTPATLGKIPPHQGKRLVRVGVVVRLCSVEAGYVDGMEKVTGSSLKLPPGKRTRTSWTPCPWSIETDRIEGALRAHPVCLRALPGRFLTASRYHSTPPTSTAGRCIFAPLTRSNTFGLGELAGGLEPPTACLQDRSATNCATPAAAPAYRAPPQPAREFRAPQGRRRRRWPARRCWPPPWR
jgi:hypothetical protein